MISLFQYYIPPWLVRVWAAAPPHSIGTEADIKAAILSHNQQAKKKEKKKRRNTKNSCPTIPTKPTNAQPICVQTHKITSPAKPSATRSGSAPSNVQKKNLKSSTERWRAMKLRTLCAATSDSSCLLPIEMEIDSDFDTIMEDAPPLTWPTHVFDFPTGGGGDCDWEMADADWGDDHAQPGGQGQESDDSEEIDGGGKQGYADEKGTVEDQDSATDTGAEQEWSGDQEMIYQRENVRFGNPPNLDISEKEKTTQELEEDTKQAKWRRRKKLGKKRQRTEAADEGGTQRDASSSVASSSESEVGEFRVYSP